MTWHKHQSKTWLIVISLKLWIQTAVLEMQIFIFNFHSWWDSWQWPGVICLYRIMCEQSTDCVIWFPTWPVNLNSSSPGICSFSWPSAVAAAWRISATCSGKPQLASIADAWNYLILYFSWKVRGKSARQSSMYVSFCMRCKFCMGVVKGLFLWGDWVGGGGIARAYLSLKLLFNLECS